MNEIIITWVLMIITVQDGKLVTEFGPKFEGHLLEGKGQCLNEVWSRGDHSETKQYWCIPLI